ncbi:hypothetical protein [Marisediminicola sp. LYQ134]|uniref:hypothetical protein n=1 Tax=unclassified Marisediminicola TaxID=2618316 RepID=UPI0039838DAE
MKFYSDFALARSRQITADVVCLGLAVIAIVSGVTVAGIIRAFAQFGVTVEEAGAGLRQTMADAADAVGSIPLVGGGVRDPFDGASGAGGALESAGRDQQIFIDNLAVALGVLIAVVPILVIARLWWVTRFAFARRATAAAKTTRLAGGMELLAFRALANADTAQILSLDRPAIEGWRDRDPETIRALAAITLQHAGVKIP